MDWSFFKPNSRYPLLRSELVYTNALPVRNPRPSPQILCLMSLRPALLFCVGQCMSPLEKIPGPEQTTS